MNFQPLSDIGQQHNGQTSPQMFPEFLQARQHRAARIFGLKKGVGNGKTQGRQYPDNPFFLFRRKVTAQGGIYGVKGNAKGNRLSVKQADGRSSGQNPMDAMNPVQKDHRRRYAVDEGWHSVG